MERPVKERLIGAAVLMAAAIILIPEMLSGPERDAPVESVRPEASRSDTPLKTYRIDLSQSPGAHVPANGGDNRAPPPEENPPATVSTPPEPAPEPQAKPESREPATRAGSTAPAPQPPAPQPRSVEQSRPTSPAPSALRPRSLASAPSAPTSTGQWAVQVGSFSRQSTAEQLAKQLRAEGHAAFVMPVESGATTLHRVRIGPMRDRATAEAQLRTLKASAPGAAVVKHP